MDPDLAGREDRGPSLDDLMTRVFVPSHSAWFAFQGTALLVFVMLTGATTARAEQRWVFRSPPGWKQIPLPTAGQSLKDGSEGTLVMRAETPTTNSLGFVSSMTATVFKLPAPMSRGLLDRFLSKVIERSDLGWPGAEVEILDGRRSCWTTGSRAIPDV